MAKESKVNLEGKEEPDYLITRLVRDGLPGGPGTRGLDGRPGVNLFLYLERVTIRGPLIIDVSGGDGGQGGHGGSGGGEVLEHFIATEETEQMEEMGHREAMARRVATWCCQVQKSNP